MYVDLACVDRVLMPSKRLRRSDDEDGWMDVDDMMRWLKVGGRKHLIHLFRKRDDDEGRAWNETWKNFALWDERCVVRAKFSKPCSNVCTVHEYVVRGLDVSVSVT